MYNNNNNKNNNNTLYYVSMFMTDERLFTIDEHLPSMCS
jgi:hypothetical protein